MKYEIQNGQLVIEADHEDQETLAQLKDEADNWDSDDVMYDLLEPLVCNSELQWVSAEDTGDLTDAPILGILGNESRKQEGPYGAVFVGCDAIGPLYCPIVERWGFMDYQVTSPQELLLREGKCVFVNQ